MAVGICQRRRQNLDKAGLLSSVYKSVISIEKSMLKQQFINLATAQKGYIEKQKKALWI